MPVNPAPFLDHGILGGFVLVLIVGIFVVFRLGMRLIDVLQTNSRDQVGALMSVEKAVKESIDKAEVRHQDTLNVFIKNTSLISETREALKTWTDRCKSLCGRSDNHAA